NLGLSLTDVATDGFVVEESDEKNAARIQGITQASIRMAAFITSFFSGLLIYAEVLTPHQMFLLVACFPLMTFLASFFIREKKVDSLSSDPKPAASISLEAKAEYQQTKKFDVSVFTKGYIASLIVIFILIILNLVFGSKIDSLLAEHVPQLSRIYFTIAIWALFGVW